MTQQKGRPSSGPRNPRGGAPRKGGKPKPRQRPARLSTEARAEMQRLMDQECIRKDAAFRIVSGELTLDQFKLRYPAEYAVSFRAKTLMEQNPEMSRARAFWLAEDPRRIEEMRQKQIRTFATYTGLTPELSKAVATGGTSLGQLARQDPRWEFIWGRAKDRIKVMKEHGHNLSPIEAIRWARGDFGLPLMADEDLDAIEARGVELHERYPFMKKRHTRRMARFHLDLDGLATVSPANCGWGPRALALWERYPGHHRKFIRLMAMMGMEVEEAAAFIARTEPSRGLYNELAASARSYYFRLYNAEREARFEEDNNPFAWSLIDEGTGEPIKQSKLHVLFFCPAVAKGAIFGMARKDKELSAQDLGAALVPTERLDIDVITETVERVKDKDKPVQVTLRNGMMFTGHIVWDSPFELKLRLKNDAWMIILYHSIYQIQATA